MQAAAQGSSRARARGAKRWRLPKFAVDFFREALAPSCKTAYLLVGRKNSKSASCSALVLGHLADGAPLRKAGFRCAVVSVTKPKAAELKQQCQDIAEASGLRGLVFKKSPAPGRIESKWGTCEVLSAADYEGHSSGFSLVLLDEIGLLGERYRALIAGLKSSLTARARADDLLEHYGRFAIHPRGSRTEGIIRAWSFTTMPGTRAAPLMTPNNYARRTPALNPAFST